METLKLPEPAAALWRRLGPSLEDATREIRERGERWTMTGGTILTARYGHRSSKVIDLQLAPSARDRLIARRCPHFMASMKELGATGGYQGVRQIVVAFPGSELDLWQRKEDQRRHPEGTERDVSIDGRIERVESNAQILHGKLKRAGRTAPVRDLYDFGVAIEIDRENLETAVNLQPIEEMDTLRKRWTDTARTYAREARTNVKSVPERFAHIQADPAGHAARATEAATWTVAELRYGDKQLKWLTTCQDGGATTRATGARTADGVRDWMTRTGIGRFIELNEPDRAAAVTATAVETAERAPAGSRTIWRMKRNPEWDPGDRGGPGGPRGRRAQMVPANPANMGPVTAGRRRGRAPSL